MNQEYITKKILEHVNNNDIKSIDDFRTQAETNMGGVESKNWEYVFHLATEAIKNIKIKAEQSGKNDFLEDPEIRKIIEEVEKTKETAVDEISKMIKIEMMRFEVKEMNIKKAEINEKSISELKKYAFSYFLKLKDSLSEKELIQWFDKKYDDSTDLEISIYNTEGKKTSDKKFLEINNAEKISSIKRRLDMLEGDNYGLVDDLAHEEELLEIAKEKEPLLVDIYEQYVKVKNNQTEKTPEDIN